MGELGLCSNTWKDFENTAGTLSQLLPAVGRIAERHNSWPPHSILYGKIGQNYGPLHLLKQFCSSGNNVYEYFINCKV